MQCRRHVDAFGEVVVADEVDVFGCEVGTNTGQKRTQVRAGPLADIVPALDTDVADDQLLLRQSINLLRSPEPFVLDQAGQFEPPGRAVNRLDILDRIIGVETRRLHHLRRTESRRQMIGAEDRTPDAVVP